MQALRVAGGVITQKKLWKVVCGDMERGRRGRLPANALSLQLLLLLPHFPFSFFVIHLNLLWGSILAVAPLDTAKVAAWMT